MKKQDALLIAVIYLMLGASIAEIWGAVPIVIVGTCLLIIWLVYFLARS